MASGPPVAPVNQNGFTLDKKTGFWAKRPGDDDHAPDMETHDILAGVRPFVSDTRNLLLLKLTRRSNTACSHPRPARSSPWH